MDDHAGRILVNYKWVNSNGRLKTAWLCAVAALSVAVAGCVTPTVNTGPRVAASFDYTPTQQAEPMSANITFAVVGADFETPVPLFEGFATSMAGDFAEILTARGYAIRGPFRSYDELTFPDKEGSNLLLSATVDFTPDTGGLEIVPLATLGSLLDTLSGSRRTTSEQQYTIKGTVRVEGRVTLVVAESLTVEKMWTKSVAIEPIDVALNGAYVFAGEPPSLAEVLEHENQFYTDLGKALEGQYVEIMERTHAYLDPREMALVDRQADSLRERKRY